MTPRDEPPVVGLRDVYNATRETGEKVTVLVVTVQQVVDEVAGQREENRRIWNAIGAVRKQMYTYGGAIAVLIFVLSNAGAVSGILSK